VDPENPENPVDPEAPTEPEEPAEPEKLIGTITASALNIRSDAGTGNAVVGTYYQGKQVEILEQKQVGNTTWGRTDQGWISLQYVQF
jgi:uncharacterized protein YgiM (DUF1202 family)